MKNWIVSHLQTVFPDEDIAEENIDVYLPQLCQHSLKMVTFLARFSRQFGRAPKIMEFIAKPNFATLADSGEAQR
ncbi:hypothetical protein AXX16_3273 [Serratia rubidaea]|uniref:hypothetical protein n=1 Tax=Serratia rubidaea TaxID=61652 RepID=UPI00078AF49D|nr:hypothetical protein [Serratia rubidaea]AML58969.1 hypothetical protein AXX16_3273 [Serratia rubidaea]